MIGCFFDALILLTITIWLLQLTIEGYLTIEQTALLLSGMVIVIAISRALGIRLRRLLLRIGLPVAALLVFAIKYGEGHRRETIFIFGEILVLLLVLIGIYITIVGPFRKR
jgi:hypothetical protein